MKQLLLWIMVFMIIYLFYLLFIILRKKKLELFQNNTGIRYLIKVYQLDHKKLDFKKIAHLIALTNAFIIATTVVIIDFIDNFYLKMFSAFILLILLQLLTYHLIGTILKRRDHNVSF